MQIFLLFVPKPTAPSCLRRRFSLFKRRHNIFVSSFEKGLQREWMGFGLIATDRVEKSERTEKMAFFCVLMGFVNNNKNTEHHQPYPLKWKVVSTKWLTTYWYLNCSSFVPIDPLSRNLGKCLIAFFIGRKSEDMWSLIGSKTQSADSGTLFSIIPLPLVLFPHFAE